MGDFNTVLHNDLDIVSGDIHDPKVVECFNNLVSDLNIFDVWRLCNPTKKDFTYSKNKPYFIARRLDYILISENCLPFCRDPDIRFFGFSDHKAVTLCIDFSSFKRGPSIYKFNTSLLKNKHFIDEVTSEIIRIKTLDLDPHLCWEYIKVSIKDIAMSYGRSIAFNKRNEKNMLINKIDSLENKLVKEYESFSENFYKRTGVFNFQTRYNRPFEKNSIDITNYISILSDFDFSSQKSIIK